MDSTTLHTKIAQYLFDKIKDMPLGSEFGTHELGMRVLKRMNVSYNGPEVGWVESYGDFKLEDSEWFDIHDILYNLIKKDGWLRMDFSKYAGATVGLPYNIPYVIRRKRIIIHSKQLRVAKQFAKANNLYDTKFLCYWYGSCVFDILHDPTLCVDKAWPLTFIIVDKELNARYTTPEEGESIFNGLLESKHPWGKAIFDEYAENPTYETDEIVKACDFNGYDVPVEKEVMYKALEEAAMLGKKVKVVPDAKFMEGGSCAGQCDGWSYHPELK